MSIGKKLFTTAIIGSEVGIDMGTANTLIYIKGQGIVLNEPSLIAINSKTQEILAVGKDAKKMVGRNPSYIKIIRPIKNGVVADFDVATMMLRAFLKKTFEITSFNKAKIILSYPMGATEVEKSALHEVGIHSGGRDVSIISAPIAALIGEGFSPKKSKAQMIVNIGAGHTEVAVCSFGEVVSHHYGPEGGDYIDESIKRYMKIKYKLYISEATAQEVKIKIGSVYPVENDRKFMEVKGRSIVDNLPRSITLYGTEIRNCICDCMASLVRSVAMTCEVLSPQISADILDENIFISGGASQIRGLKEYMKDTLGLDVVISENPTTSVVNGLGKVLQNVE